jgi:hypothetical protein
MVRLREVSVDELLEAGMPDQVCDPYGVTYRAMDADEQVALRLSWEHWMNRLLATAIEEPAFLRDERKINLMGPDRDRVGYAMLRRWGILSDTPGRLDTTMKRRHFLGMVQRFSLRMRMLPTDVLAMPASKFWRNYLILFGDFGSPDEEVMRGA